VVDAVWGQGGVSFIAPIREFRVGRIPLSVTVGDFNGDGRQDLATANFSSTVSILLGRGDGSFETAPRKPVGRDVPLFYRFSPIFALKRPQVQGGGSRSDRAHRVAK
jgi:hypothetical protein